MHLVVLIHVSRFPTLCVSVCFSWAHFHRVAITELLPIMNHLAVPGQLQDILPLLKMEEFHDKGT